jgi:hypothetical protein
MQLNGIKKGSPRANASQLSRLAFFFLIGYFDDLSRIARG